MKGGLGFFGSVFVTALALGQTGNESALLKWDTALDQRSSLPILRYVCRSFVLV